MIGICKHCNQKIFKIDEEPNGPWRHVKFDHRRNKELVGKVNCPITKAEPK